MTKRVLSILTVLPLLFQSGCSDPPRVRDADTRLRLKVGQRVLKTTVAYTDGARKMGLMNRDALEEDSGALRLSFREEAQLLDEEHPHPAFDRLYQ